MHLHMCVCDVLRLIVRCILQAFANFKSIPLSHPNDECVGLALKCPQATPTSLISIMPYHQYDIVQSLIFNFPHLFQSTPCKHPVILLQDVNFLDLHSLVEFIYHGEVNVHQKSLQSFLKTAEVLRVSGLTQQQAEETHSVSLHNHTTKVIFPIFTSTFILAPHSN